MIRRAPSFWVYFPANEASLRQGIEEFSQLLRNLSSISEYMAGLVFTAGQGSAESLFDPMSVPSEDVLYDLDPTKDFDEIIEFLSRVGLDNADGLGSYGIWGESSQDRRMIKSLRYRWSARPNSGLLTYQKWRGVLPNSGAHLSHWLRIIESVIEWKRPNYLWCGDPNYISKKKGIFYPERTIANWFCWVPQQVEPSQIPSAAIVRPMLDGTLIVSLEKYFNIDNLEAVQRVNDVEVEMNEAGILPHHTELNGA